MTHHSHPESFSEYARNGALYVPEGMENDLGWAELAEHGIGAYEALRLADPSFESLSDSEIDDELESIFEGMSEADIESFWQSVKNAARGVAGVASKVAQPLLRTAGTVVGGIYGGPAGARIGGQIGNAVGGFASQGLSTLSRGGRVRLNARGYGNRVRSRARAVGRAVGPVISRAATQGVNHFTRYIRQPGVQQAVGRAAMGLGGQIMNAAGQALSANEVAEAMYQLAQIEGHETESFESFGLGRGAGTDSVDIETFIAWADKL